MKVLFVSPEISPFARTGGLGEVVGSLPFALKSGFLGEHTPFNPQGTKVSTKKLDCHLIL